MGSFCEMSIWTGCVVNHQTIDVECFFGKNILLNIVGVVIFEHFLFDGFGGKIGFHLLEQIVCG